MLRSICVFFAGAAAVAVAVAASGCSSGSAGSAAPAGPVTIGESTTLSGSIAELGQSGLQGVHLAAANLQLAARGCPGRSGEWTIAKVHDTFPKLAQLSGRRAGLLSGGEQQMLKLGRALLTQPGVLLLDEPTEGLSPVMVSEVGGWLQRLRAAHLSVLLTEQSAVFALRHADRGYIIEKGQVRAEGTALHLRSGSELHEFLGVGLDGGPGDEVPASGPGGAA